MKNKNIHIVIERLDANKIIFRCKNNSKKEIVESKSAKSQVRRQTTCPFKLRANYSLKNKYWLLVVMNDRHDHEIGNAAGSMGYSLQLGHLSHMGTSHMFGMADDYKRMNPPPQDAFSYGALDYLQVQPHLVGIYQQNLYHYNQSPHLQQLQQLYIQPLHQIPLNQQRHQLPQQLQVQQQQQQQQQLPQQVQPEVQHQVQHQVHQTQQVSQASLNTQPPLQATGPVAPQLGITSKSNSALDVFSNFMGSTTSLSPVAMLTTLTPLRDKDGEYMLHPQGYRKRSAVSGMVQLGPNGGKRRKEEGVELKSAEEVAVFLRKEVNFLVLRNVVFNSHLSAKDKTDLMDSFTLQFIVDHADSFSQVFLDTMQQSKNGHGAAVFMRTRSDDPTFLSEHNGNTASIIKTTGTIQESRASFPISPLVESRVLLQGSYELASEPAMYPRSVYVAKETVPMPARSIDIALH